MNVKFQLSRKLRRVWSENETCTLVVECKSLEQAQDWLVKELLDEDDSLENDVLEGRWEELDKDCVACEVVEGPTIETVEVVGDEYEFPDVILGDEP